MKVFHYVLRNRVFAEVGYAGVSSGNVHASLTQNESLYSVSMTSVHLLQPGRGKKGKEGTQCSEYFSKYGSHCMWHHHRLMDWQLGPQRGTEAPIIYRLLTLFIVTEGILPTWWDYGTSC